jgi:hypothetical protein
MAVAVDRRSSASAQARRAVDEVLKIARADHAGATVSGGSKPHVSITKQATSSEDTYFRAMLSGIEYATHSHFSHGQESGGYTEWVLRSRLIDVTLRCTKGLG